MNNLLPGPVYSIVTPFKEDFEIDFNSIEDYICNAHQYGAKQFYVMGYNSRLHELSWDEIKKLNRFVNVKPYASILTALRILKTKIY